MIAGGDLLELAQLLDELEYVQSNNYHSTSEGLQEPLTEHLFRSAQKAGATGAYFFQTSPAKQRILPPRPAVFVAEAKTREQAREIHRKLWNLGNAPFIIILLPNEIRVYTGFDFSQENERKGLIKAISSIVNLTFESIRQQLSDFQANSIDCGILWQSQFQHLTPDRRVDIHLLNNLRKLEEYLTNEGLELPIIHALIGKYVYIRYLYDRGILSDDWLSENDLNLESVLGREATLDSLLRLTRVLEDRFNGEIFPFPPTAESTLSDQIISIIASTFKGDDPESGQLHLNFEAYDFSYIPVETLSSIYEQFLKSQGTGKKIGAIYTPEPVADYLLCELNASQPLAQGMKILDPCCGSGIFLVLAYRRLIEMALAQSKTGKLKPTELGKILCDSIYGVERNRDACYVAEFSLILTLLNYLEPPDLHRNKQFKFPSLHNTQIFECDFFDDESDFWNQNIEFDWIIGNPPWIELKPKTKGEDLARNWIQNNLGNRPVGGNRVGEAFSWRVLDLLASNGCVGLLVHANSLFNHESQKYRAAFFHNQLVERVTNFAHLAYVLFGGRGEEPAATLIYRKSEPGIDKPEIVHYAPFIVNQLSNRPWKQGKKKTTWTITINENEISTISSQEAASGDMLVWKIALWGSWRDHKAFKRLQRIFPITLGELINQRNWQFHKGLQIRQQNSGSGLESAPYLAGWKKVDVHTKVKLPGTSRTNFRFIVPENSLHLIPEDFLFISKRGGRSPFVVARAPHLMIRAGYCIFSDIDFVIPDPRLGISADEVDADYLRAVSVLLNSSIAQYFLFFRSSSWGVGRSRIYVNDFKQIPLPDLSQQHISELVKLQKRLAYLEEYTDMPDDSLQRLLDDTVESLFSISRNIGIIAREFISIRLQLNQGKTITSATESPTENHLQAYGLQLRNELDSFTEGSGLKHKVVVTYSKDLIVCSVEFIQSDNPLDVMTEQAERRLNEFLASIRKKSRRQFSQWIYVQRSLRIFEDAKVYICKPPRLIDWTQTQALNDSDDIIAEILSPTHGLHEVVQ